MSDSSGGSRWDPARVDAVLAERASAYRRGDAAAWGRLLQRTPGWADEAAALRLMKQLQVADVVFGRVRADGDGFQADLHFQLGGRDTASSSVVRRWVPSGEDLRPAGPPQLPWDEPDAAAVLAGAAIAVGAVGMDVLRAAAETAEQAAAEVATLWPGPVLRPLLWLPRDADLFARGAGADRDQQGVPAVTIGEVRDGRSVGADRVVINPTLWPRLGPEGRAVVLRHETAHLALRRDLGGPRPLALIEGLCEYVAYRHAPVAPDAVAAPLTRRLARDGLPARLPREEDFAGPGRAAAYAASWLLAETVARHAGEQALVRWVRSAHGTQIEDPGVLAPLTVETGWDASQLRAAWRARVAMVTSVR